MDRVLENRMVLAPEWPEAEREASRKLKGPGWTEIGTGIFVPEEYAYEHALERLSLDEELQKEFVEWHYSGNYVREDGYGTD